MTPIITPLRGFTTENHRVLPLVPQTPIIATVPEHRILMSFWEREVKIWRIEELQEVMPADLNLDDETQGRKLLSRMIVSHEEHITSAAITPLPLNAGFLLAVATSGGVKLFYLRNSKRPGSHVLRPQRIAIPNGIPLKSSVQDNSSGEDSDEEEDIDLAEEGARHLQFTPDGKRLLVITPDSRVLVATLDITIPADRKEKPTFGIASPIDELDRELPPITAPTLKAFTPSKKKSRQRQDEGTHGTYLRTITKAAFSSTSRLLAVGDLLGNITTFVLSDGTWSRITTSIPRLPAAPAILSFRPAPTSPQISSGDDDGEAPDAELLILPADTHVILLFSATSGRLTPWSQENPMPGCVPVDFASVLDRAVGAFWEDSNPNRAWVYGASWVWMFDFSRQWPNHGTKFDVVQSDGKRKRGAPVGIGSISGAGAMMPTPMGPKTEHATTTEDDTDFEDEILSDSDEQMEEGKKVLRKQRGQKPFWGSFRYRSLLGFLPVGKREVLEMAGEGWEEERGLEAVEMVVVERPVWDVGLPPRFYDGRS